MTQKEEPEDFVIATGEGHSVREFAEKAFDVVGLDWQKYVKTDKRFVRPLDVECLKGDPFKAKQKLKWVPKVSFEQLVKIMVNEDLLRWKRYLKGERFPWDAPNYPTEINIITRSLRM